MRDLLLVLIGLAVVALLCLQTYRDYRRFHNPLLTTPYQAVTLRDGSVLVGRIDHLGTDYPVLRRALEIRRSDGSGPSGGKANLVPLKDGPFGGDHVIFPAASILRVQPIEPNSEIGRLISERGL